MSAPEIPCCDACRPLLDTAHRRIAQLEAELAATRAQLREVVKHDALQGEDLARLRDEYERIKPHCPERVPGNEAQLAFEHVLATFHDLVQANDEAKSGETSTSPDTKGHGPKRRHCHGRRRLDLTRLPVESVEIDPPEVTAAGRAGFVRIGEEASDRIQAGVHRDFGRAGPTDTV